MADIREVFVGSELLLLSAERDYRIAHNHDIAGGDGLTDSLHS